MAISASHGRGAYGAWRKLLGPVALPALVALGLGVSVGVRFAATDRSVLELERLQLLGQSTRALGDEVTARIESVKPQLVAFRRLHEVEVRSGIQAELQSRPSSGILHFAQYQVDSNGTASLRQAVSAEALSRRATLVRGAPFEDAYLPFARELASRATTSPLVATVRPDPQRAREWIALAFPSGNGEVLVGLADPSELFGQFSRFAQLSEGGALRAYLLGDRGQVLAHSISELAGADFSSQGVFKEGVVQALRGNRSLGGGTFNSHDRARVQASYGRIGAFPLAVVVERLSLVEASSLATMIESGAWKTPLGEALLAVLIVTLVILMASRLASARSVLGEAREDETRSGPPGMTSPEVSPIVELLARAQMDAVISPPAAHTVAPAVELEPAVERAEDKPVKRVTPPPPPMAARGEKSSTSNTALNASPAVAALPRIQVTDAGVAASLESMTANQSQAQAYELKKTLQEHALVSEFEADSLKIRNPRIMAERMTDLTSNLCRSPTLFFSYVDATHSAVLHRASGFGPDERLPTLDFRIDARLLSLVSSPERVGQLISVDSYEPLSRLILARFGTAHFEAYALTGFSVLGRAAQRPRLLGVLVVLRAGADSIGRREVIGRMMRCTGMAYENALLST